MKNFVEKLLNAGVIPPEQRDYARSLWHAHVWSLARTIVTWGLFFLGAIFCMMALSYGVHNILVRRAVAAIIATGVFYFGSFLLRSNENSMVARGLFLFGSITAGVALTEYVFFPITHFSQIIFSVVWALIVAGIVFWTGFLDQALLLCFSVMSLAYAFGAQFFINKNIAPLYVLGAVGMYALGAWALETKKYYGIGRLYTTVSFIALILWCIFASSIGLGADGMLTASGIFGLSISVADSVNASMIYFYIAAIAAVVIALLWAIFELWRRRHDALYDASFIIGTAGMLASYLWYEPVSLMWALGANICLATLMIAAVWRAIQKRDGITFITSSLLFVLFLIMRFSMTIGNVLALSASYTVMAIVLFFVGFVLEKFWIKSKC